MRPPPVASQQHCREERQTRSQYGRPARLHPQQLAETHVPEPCVLSVSPRNSAFAEVGHRLVQAVSGDLGYIIGYGLLHGPRVAPAHSGQPLTTVTESAPARGISLTTRFPSADRAISPHTDRSPLMTSTSCDPGPSASCWLKSTRPDPTITVNAASKAAMSAIRSSRAPSLPFP